MALRQPGLEGKVQGWLVSEVPGSARPGLLLARDVQVPNVGTSLTVGWSTVELRNAGEVGAIRNHGSPGLGVGPEAGPPDKPGSPKCPLLLVGFHPPQPRILPSAEPLSLTTSPSWSDSPRLYSPCVQWTLLLADDLGSTQSSALASTSPEPTTEDSPQMWREQGSRVHRSPASSRQANLPGIQSSKPWQE